MGIKRYWVNSEGEDRKAIARACEWMMTRLREGDVGLIVVPTKAALMGAFSKEQPQIAYALDHKGTISGDGATLAIMTEATPPTLEPTGPAMVLHANMSLLNLTESTEGINRILAVPWTRSDIELWINTWAPKQIPSR